MNSKEYNYEFDGDLVNSVIQIFNSFTKEVAVGYDDGFTEYSERLPVEKKDDFIKAIEQNLNSKLIKEENIQEFKPYVWKGVTGYTIVNSVDLREENGKITHFKITLSLNGYEAGALDQSGIIYLHFKMFGECISTKN